MFALIGRPAGYIRKPRTRAAATVELAIVLPILLMLLFGIVEFGLIFKDALLVQQAAREGARAAAVGAPPAQIRSVVESAAPTLDASLLTVVSQWRQRGSFGEWSDWQELGVGADGSNDAPQGAQIRVKVTYRHRFVTGGLFSWLANDESGEAIVLASAMVARRE